MNRKLLGRPIGKSHKRAYAVILILRVLCYKKLCKLFCPMIWWWRVA